MKEGNRLVGNNRKYAPNSELIHESIKGTSMNGSETELRGKSKISDETVQIMQAAFESLTRCTLLGRICKL